MRTLQGLYDSEIDFEISTDWDSGFDVILGRSEKHCYPSAKARANFRTIEEAINFLDRQARIHYPESQYAMITSMSRTVKADGEES